MIKSNVFRCQGIIGDSTVDAYSLTRDSLRYRIKLASGESFCLDLAGLRPFNSLHGQVIRQAIELETCGVKKCIAV